MSGEPNVTSIKVRMYRQGFGDCFLLSFYAGDDRVFTMLIDCGIKYNTKPATFSIEDMIEDLKDELTPSGGDTPKLDVLVATHEHWDHIAYFHPERFNDLFADFDVGRVWLAWTEDARDKEARAINSRLREGAAALHVAASRLEEAKRDETEQSSDMYFGGNVAAARDNFNQGMDDILGFYGTALKEVSESGIRYKKNGKISTMTEDAMENVIAIGKRGGGIKYLRPGEVVDKRDVPSGVNVFVLGPPRSSLMNQSNPSGGGHAETYFGIDDNGMASFVDGLLDMEDGGSGGDNVANPFGDRDGIGKDSAEADNHPYLARTYFAENEAYRQIEYSWLDIAGPFALQLDGAVNNTSLVLAIEFAGSRKVLLFPGDAQVGSWLSWHKQDWRFRRDGRTHRRDAEELLRNTVLYKVSHHGSHNATVKDKGLEMMTHPELVAMIPEKEESYSGILYQPLMDRLGQMCKGRVLVSADATHKPENLIQGKKPDEISDGEWRAFKRDVKVEKLYVEYTVRG